MSSYATVLGIRTVTLIRYSRKWLKNMAYFYEICKNHGTDTTSDHMSKDLYTFYKTQHLALMTIITRSARFARGTY